ncbi:lamin tail domain-containing protein 2 [Echinops telfairi]|uniref:Lamin tail domain-containing protein 2 n=1 Tax=Echinops telfairi TaxID=9371 RepID=A0ABM0J8K5_ECHTE|nr:lamin tail domain-containing protein 2 [Echinops telfairi]
MDSKAQQDTEEVEEEAHSSLADYQPCGHLGPPAGTSTPRDKQYIKPWSSQVSFPTNLQTDPVSMDPRTLRLLWEQRELEIQALRWVLRGGRDAHYHQILEEVVGIPPERGSRNQERVLQNRVQKLTLELKEQKQQAQLEKEQLQQQLVQTLQTLQKLEEELQAFQKSCLLQLAGSSWVGRILRSQTGSVEVVTAEAVMDTLDTSENENERAPPPKEGFQLKDVDWNSIAQRYPNLQPRPAPHPPAATWSSQSYHRKPLEGHTKSVEWSFPPSASSSSPTSYTCSDTCSSQLSMPSMVQKVTGHPPGECSSFHAQHIRAKENRFRKDQPGRQPADLQKTLGHKPHQADLRPEASPDTSHPPPGLVRDTAPLPAPASHRLAGSGLKIVAVSSRDKFIRILNQSLDETVDLGGFVLQQLVRSFPKGRYRFPAGTVLEPGHHVTVWGVGASSKKHQQASVGGELGRIHSGHGCVTLLLNSKGQVLSEFHTPPSVAPVSPSRVFSDNIDLSIDRFPLAEAPLDTHSHEQPQQPPSQPGSLRRGQARGPQGKLRKPRRDVLPLLSPKKREASGWSECTKAVKPLPSLREVRPSLQDRTSRKEHRVQVCRKGVDCRCPMVALSVQRTAESRYGFRFLSCLPFTVDTCGRL